MTGSPPVEPATATGKAAYLLADVQKTPAPVRERLAPASADPRTRALPTLSDTESGEVVGPLAPNVPTDHSDLLAEVETDRPAVAPRGVA